MKFAPLFTDGLILAENKKIRIFGESDTEVTVSFRENKVTAKPDKGKWIAEFPESEAGGPYEITAESDGEQTVLKNVYVGKVYLLIGQSNAEFQLAQSNTPLSEYEDDGLLRDFFVVRPWIEPDVFSYDAGWRCAAGDGVGKWSALGYLTGRRIRKNTGKAVGIVSCFQGASVIESWLPENEAKKFSLPREKLYIDHYYPDFSAWNGNGVIYEKMLSNVFPFSFNGVIFYQGESDTTVYEAEIYEKELLCLMDKIREAEFDPELFFAVVQIADYDHRRENDPDGWRGIQLAQESAVKNGYRAALVRSADICESSEIHPPTKTLLAQRIAEVLTEDEK